MENKNQTGLKNFKPKINLNQNIYTEFMFMFLIQLLGNFLFLNDSVNGFNFDSIT